MHAPPSTSPRLLAYGCAACLALTLRPTAQDHVGSGLERTGPLLAEQRDDGHWALDGAEPTRFTTALGTLALMTEGSRMRSGPRRDEVKKGVRALYRDALFRGTPRDATTLEDDAAATLMMTLAYALDDYKLLRQRAYAALVAIARTLDDTERGLEPAVLAWAALASAAARRARLGDFAPSFALLRRRAENLDAASTSTAVALLVDALDPRADPATGAGRLEALVRAEERSPGHAGPRDTLLVALAVAASTRGARAIERLERWRRARRTALRPRPEAAPVTGRALAYRILEQAVTFGWSPLLPPPESTRIELVTRSGRAHVDVPIRARLTAPAEPAWNQPPDSRVLFVRTDASGRAELAIGHGLQAELAIGPRDVESVAWMDAKPWSRLGTVISAPATTRRFVRDR